MDIGLILTVIQIVLAVLLVFLVLIQQSESGVGAVLGGGSDIEDEGQHKRRGSEKIIFITTIVVSVLFVTSVILSLFLG